MTPRPPLPIPPKPPKPPNPPKPPRPIPPLPLPLVKGPGALTSEAACPTPLNFGISGIAACLVLAYWVIGFIIVIPPIGAYFGAAFAFWITIPPVIIGVAFDLFKTFDFKKGVSGTPGFRLRFAITGVAETKLISSSSASFNFS